MLKIRLVMVNADNILVFRVGWPFRIVSSVGAVALFAAGVVLGTYAVSFGMALFLLLGSLYEESVRFDRGRQQGEFRLGLVFLFRRRTFALDQVAEVRVAGFGPARFVGLALGLADGRELTIENDRGKVASERLIAWGTELAHWLKVPLNR